MMKHKTYIVIALALCLAAAIAAPASARESAKPLRLNRSLGADELGLPAGMDPGLRGLYEAAAADSYCLAWYTFDPSGWQGWTRFDNTAQRDTFFHVDNFAGLGGGSFGRLVPISGTKSMWCGARATGADDYICGWATAPGYGNNWEQYLTTDAFAFSGLLTVSYHGVFDSEPGFDRTYVEYDAGGGNWAELARYEGVVDTVAAHVINSTQARTKLRFHFSADGGFSDEDGSYASDGGAILDDIHVQDAGGLINNTQNFEGAPVSATTAGIWHGIPATPFGLYAGLRNNLQDKDPCGDNFSTQIVFFVGSPNPSAGYPGLYDTPFCSGAGGIEAPCQFELVVSPVLDLTKYSTAPNGVQNADIPAGDLPLLGGATLLKTVYRDLSVSNLVVYVEYIRNIDAGCPGPWVNDYWLNYGENQDYIFEAWDFSHLVSSDRIQVGIGVWDLCSNWYLVYGNCAQHTPSPWFDNVRVYRYKSVGPQFTYRELELFQDNFPEEEFDIESFVRADMAADINNNDDPVTRPGDSIVVQCTSPLGGGLAIDAGEPAIYLHAKAAYVGFDGLKPAKIVGPVMAGTYGRYVSDDGTWTVIQGDTAVVSGSNVDNWYMFDLNDSLFTRGYRIEYYFRARDAAGTEAVFPHRTAAGAGFINDPPYLEFTCLPTKNSNVLFVNDFGARPDYFFKGTVRAYWDPALEAVLPANNLPDYFDVNDADGAVSNGPGSRAKNQQLTDAYSTIIWDSGNLTFATITDGTVNSDKSNDCQMLIDWMNLSPHRCGLWILGDDVAFDLDALASAPAIALMSTWCGVDLVASSYYNLTGGRTGGGVVSPLLAGDPEGIFYHAGTPDRFYAFGGCAVINSFDVLEKTANGAYALQYPPYGGASYYGGIQSARSNAAGFDVRTMWFGFSYSYLRNDELSAPIDRFHAARDVLEWMQNPVNPNVTPAETPAATKLAQNFPNPFNPSTTIRFDLKDKGLTTLKIYNVSGQLVRTLVNGVKDAGSYSVTWDGMNDRGSAVASGIYFYKMDTKDFSQTRKMVMLR